METTAVSGLASAIRSRLIIDRYSSVLSRLPLRRQVSVADPASRDAEIWNIFRTLSQMNPSLWLPGLFSLGRISPAPGPEELAAGIGLTLWKRVKAPPERLAWLHRRALRGELRPPVGRRRKGRIIPLSELRGELKSRARRHLPLEQPVEVDAIVKCSGSVLFVQMPRPDDSPDHPASADSDRTFLLRLIDAGLSYAEARSRARRGPVGFALLILPQASGQEEAWARALRSYAVSPARLRRDLPHRGAGFDPSLLVRGLGVGAWSGIKRLLSDLRREVHDPFEAGLLDRLLGHGKPAAFPRAN